MFITGNEVHILQLVEKQKPFLSSFYMIMANTQLLFPSITAEVYTLLKKVTLVP
jgi:hypothetical protein